MKVEAAVLVFCQMRVLMGNKESSLSGLKLSV